MSATVQAKVLPQGGAFVYKEARGKLNLSLHYNRQPETAVRRLCPIFIYGR